MSDSNDTLIIKEATENKPDTAPVKPASILNRDVTKNVKEAKTSKTTTPDGDSVPVEVVNPENLEFNRANIEAMGNHIHLVDSDEDNKLDMFCYVKCSDTDNKLLKQCRGVVFNGNDLVMKAFPYTNEYNHTETDSLNETVLYFKDWTFYKAHEGTLIRLFNFGGKWFVSTHRKLDAFRSKWASRESFGTSFTNALSAEEENNTKLKASLPEGDNILDRFQSTLDVTKQYMFLIRNTKDNRIVCSAPERATVFHVGTFVEGVLVMTENVNIPSPEKVTFLNIGELQSFVDKISYKDYQGVIGFTKDNHQVKVLHKDYQDLFRSRGNEPSIKFRYLQIRMNRRFVNMLYHLYPNMAETFDEYENTLYDIARSIYRAYVQRFIKKRYVTVPREEFAIIRECHSWHLTDRTENRISLDQVVRIMNQQSPTQLNHMIRRFKLDQTRQKEQNGSNRPRSDSGMSTKSFEQSPAVRNINHVTVPPSPLFLAANNVTKNKNGNSRTVSILTRKPLYKPKSVLAKDPKEVVADVVQNTD
jgi:hypothetical protein